MCFPVGNRNLYYYRSHHESFIEDLEINFPDLSVARSFTILMLYKIPHLIHIHNKQGILEIFQIDIMSKVVEKLPFKIDIMHECSHIPQAFDNLLFLHNTDALFTKIYDLKVSPANESLCKNLPLNNKHISERIS